MHGSPPGPQPPTPDPTALTPERWRVVRALFDEALAREPARRAAFVRAAAAGDAALAREVVSLLAALDEEDDRFEQPAVAQLAGRAEARTGPAMEGRRIGAYRVLREVGQGGMGSVYEAARADDQYRKRVAIKVIKRGMDSDLVVRRFRRERQILAGLEHPNIAALLDGGVTDDGQPYVVLEFVEGLAITEYCAARGLGVRGRLELFLQVCDPVQYAHRNLVVHRDLKPSNILVTDGGTPKLLDFGVAKLLGAEHEGDAPLTQAGLQAFTPEYASPEQLRGEPITTAADIYSLGVLLYELLTGQRPFEAGRRSRHEMARIVGGQEPTRPSAAVPGGAGSRTGLAEPARLRRELAGELDSIVLKAIAPTPQQRYSSAEALAEDVRRYLDGRPVLARQGTAGYRARKFVGRHRVSVAAALLVLLSLAAGALGTVAQARRAEAARQLAEQRFGHVRELANSLLFEVHDAIAVLPGATAARALLVERSLEYLDRLYREAGGDAELEYELAEAYLKLGGVQGDPNHPNLGDLAGARESFGRALGLAHRLVARSPDDPRLRHTLALAHEKLGDVEAWAGDVPGGVAHVRAALESRRAIAAWQPDSASARLRLAVTMVKLGDLLGHPGFPNLGDAPGAMRQYDEALALLGSLSGGEAGRPSVRRYVGVLYERRGRMLEQAGRYDAALADLQASRAIRERLAVEAPDDAHVLRDAGIAHERLCSVYLGRGAAETAYTHCGAALDVYRRLEAMDPEDVEGHLTRAIGERWFARALAARGHAAAGLTALAASTETLERLAAADSGNANLRRQLARNLLHASAMHARRAASPGLPAARAREHRQHAASLHERGRALLLEQQRDGGPLPVGDAALLRDVAAYLRAAPPAG